MGDTIQHVKVQRKRWYDDALFKDDSIPPDDAPTWTVSSSYISDSGNKEIGGVASNIQEEGSNQEELGEGSRFQELGEGSRHTRIQELGEVNRFRLVVGSVQTEDQGQTEVQGRAKEKEISRTSAINDILNH